uniref:DUF3504 domain-containing protein n=1 Tax=Mesocestoides corti TaxID=53468 RepID=A0A5K3FFB1_MESCO
MTVCRQNMTAIDPDSCQLVEVPIDASGTIVVQDPGTLIAGGQVQVGGIVQSGKSLLKPELAQHLIQPVGIRSVIDPRVSQTAQRGGRFPARKPLGSAQGMQVIQGTQLIQQPTVLTPTASGLLSLGTRYTPSSGITLGAATGAGAASGILANSQGSIFTSGGSTMVTTTGTGVDRDAGYRLAAAMTGASSRGRPRGRRPLRGQFPVVPIDMVRQLGIEQQVILQPAAPVAMRNKAILCRPLSVSCKTQAKANTRDVACQFSEEEEALVSKPDEDVEEDEMMVVEERAVPIKEDVEDLEEVDIFSDKNDSDFETGPKKSIARKSEVGANTDVLSTSHLSTQTDDTNKVEDVGSKEDEKKDGEKVKYVPIPIPVPIYVPVPVYLYARPVPFALPFPLPCVVPLPLVLKGDEVTGGIVESEYEKDRLKPEPGQATKPAQTSVEATSKPLQQKRAARDSLTSFAPAAAAAAAPQHQVLPSKRQRQSPEAPLVAQPPPPPPHRTPTTTSDATYHLKFSYGINAWRHWASHTSQPKVVAELLDASDDELNAALTRFVHEVRKPNNETYVADSIFYLCLGIQEYLNENGRIINLFGEPRFASFARALDTVLADFQPRISPEGLLICRIEEEHLWEARQLGADSPNIMLFSLLYFITKHLWLRTGDQHAQLRFVNFKVKREQPSIESIFFVPTEGSDSYRMFVSAEQLSRCPVRLYRTYLKKCPQAVIANGGSLYLRPLVEPSASTWFSDTPMTAGDLQIMLNRIKMVKEIQEAFMDSQSD